MEPFMQQSSPSKFGVISIISTIVVITLIIGLALLSFFLEPEAPVSAEPVPSHKTTTDTEAIDAALAIAVLAGVSETDVIQQAINKARPDTALATIMFSPDVRAKEAAGALLLLGEKFSQKNNLARAILSYQLAGTMATLSPDLSDTLRADIFLQAGSGLTALDEPILAKIYLDQAFLVATESPYLQAAYRHSVLDALHRAYLDLGLKEEARNSLNLGQSPANLEAVPERPLVLPDVQSVALPMDAQEAEAQRWRAAQFVVKDLVELGGTVRPENLETLRLTLLKEDEVKSRYFSEAIQAESQLSGKVNLIRARIAWQSTKYRIAKQAFGIGVVPEWESFVGQIEADLDGSYEELYQLYNDIIVAIPIASDIDRATEEAIRRQVLAGELGHYPNNPAEELKAQLLAASATLLETQPRTELRVSYLSVENTDYYTLISEQDIVQQ
jgi:hypothetical protein